MSHDPVSYAIVKEREECAQIAESIGHCYIAKEIRNRERTVGNQSTKPMMRNEIELKEFLRQCNSLMYSPYPMCYRLNLYDHIREAIDTIQWVLGERQSTYVQLYFPKQ